MKYWSQILQLAAVAIAVIGGIPIYGRSTP